MSPKRNNITLLILTFFLIINTSISQLNSTILVNKINQARSNPSDFALKLQQNYSTFSRYKWYANGTVWNTYEGLLAVLDAITYLQSLSSMPNLTYSIGISATAQLHANTIYGNASLLMSPYYGCQNQTAAERVSVAGSWTSIAESIIGGIQDEELAVVSLIIGDGDPLRRNRLNILNSQFTHIGIGVINDTNLTNLAVIDLAQNFVCEKLCPIIPLNSTYYCTPNPYQFSHANTLSVVNMFITVIIMYILFIFN